jgi:all-trans-retinol 13,14-reductase
LYKVKYDIVIIGSGLGGLTCGSILSQQGYKVCILEKHYQIGGCLQIFKRKGKSFDTGMHYIGSFGEGEILNKLFRYFGIYDKIKAEKLNENAFDIITFGGEEYSYPQGVENFKNSLLEKFPEEKDGINTYFSKILEINNSIDILNLRDISNFGLTIKNSMDINVYEYIKSITKNQSLQNILAGLNSLYAGEQDSAPLFIHAVITKFFLQSAWRLIGGGNQIANALKKVIEANGGVLKTRAKVVKLLYDGNQITKLKLENGELIDGATFISSIHPTNTINLVEEGAFKKAYVKRLNKLENTISTFSLYIALKEKSFKYINSNIYYYKNANVWELTDYRVKDWPVGFMLYTTESKKNPGYAESLIVLSPMHYAEMKAWENTSIGNRGEDYKEMKKQKAEQLLNLVEHKFPDIRSCIDEYFSSTPLTYRDYTGTIEGSMYGIKHNCNSPLHSVVLPNTKIKNLFLTGQNTNLHGILGVSLGAVLTCGSIIGLNNIIAKIRNEKA